MTSRVAPAELKSWIESGEEVAVLDVRSAAEFAAEHIDGAYNVPVDLVADDLAARPQVWAEDDDEESEDAWSLTGR